MKKNYIILPLYNDWVSLKKVLDILNNTLKNTNNNHIIIVNDCSTITHKKKIKYTNFKSIKILNLKKNVGSQKAIFFGLKYLQKILKKNISKSTISVLDSDGEDNPKIIKNLIKIVQNKKDYFIFVSRKKRMEGIFFRILNQLRLIITYILTGRYINFGNFSSFPAKLLKKLLSNNNLYLAYSSGVLKNYNKFFFIKINKNKRFYEKSKVNFSFLFVHMIKIISVYYKQALIRSAVLALILVSIFNKIEFKLITIFFFLILNFTFFYIYHFTKPDKENLSVVKNFK